MDEEECILGIIETHVCVPPHMWTYSMYSLKCITYIYIYYKGNTKLNVSNHVELLAAIVSWYTSFSILEVLCVFKIKVYTNLALWNNVGLWWFCPLKMDCASSRRQMQWTCLFKEVQTKIYWQFTPTISFRLIPRPHM